MKHISLLSILLTLVVCSAYAQGTFTDIHSLLQTRCAGNGCHNGTTQTFDVTQNETDLYNELMGNPINPAALAKGDKLIKPGYPAESFLLRKIAHGLSDVLEIEQAEGNDMPPAGGALEDYEVELFRQWIIYGAPQDGVVADTALINTYYRDGGIDGTIVDHEPPAAGEGFQMYMGRIFLPPLTEKEFFLKVDPRNSEAIEVPKITTFLPNDMHHFVIYNFLPGTSGNFNDGLRNALDLQEQDSHAVLQNPIPTGPGTFSYDLPDGTAYYWAENTVFDLNLHIRNSSPDQIMSTDMYVNIYTQDVGTTDDYMKVAFFPNFDFYIPQDNQEHTVTSVATDSSADAMWDVWSIVTHTHKYGTDYDVYQRNPDGTRGDQVYEGFYSYELDFNTGYYRTGPETTVLYYPDNQLLEVDPRHGFIHEAKFVNTNGPDPVGWGLTSDDEMMVLSIQYIDGAEITGVNEIAPIEDLKLYPNPAQNNFRINFNLLEDADVNIGIQDLRGKQVANLYRGTKTSGSFAQNFDTEKLGLTAGIYLVNIAIDEAIVSKKLIITE